VKKTDAHEFESFYYQYYENYVQALDQGEQADRYLYKLIFLFSLHRHLEHPFHISWRLLNDLVKEVMMQ